MPADRYRRPADIVPADRYHRPADIVPADADVPFAAVDASIAGGAEFEWEVETATVVDGRAAFAFNFFFLIAWSELVTVSASDLSRTTRFAITHIVQMEAIQLLPLCFGLSRVRSAWSEVGPEIGLRSYSRLGRMK